MIGASAASYALAVVVMAAADVPEIANARTSARLTGTNRAIGLASANLDLQLRIWCAPAPKAIEDFQNDNFVGGLVAIARSERFHDSVEFCADHLPCLPARN